jgi:hypothetical protein
MVVLISQDRFNALRGVLDATVVNNDANYPRWA